MIRENPFAEQDTWQDSKDLHGLGTHKKSKPKTTESPLTREQKIAIEEGRDAQRVISEVNANLNVENDLRALNKEIDVAFGNIQETPEQRAQRLHKAGKGQTLEVPPEVRKAG